MEEAFKRKGARKRKESVKVKAPTIIDINGGKSLALITPRVRANAQGRLASVCV